VDIVAAADDHVALPKQADLFIHPNPNGAGADINKLDFSMEMGIKRNILALVNVHRKLGIQFPILIERFHLDPSVSLKLPSLLNVLHDGGRFLFFS
jgi:hypothetical protein